MMQLSIRKIGNSRGLILPAPYLTNCGISDFVDVEIDGQTIIIKASHKIREGWFDSISSIEEETSAETTEWIEADISADGEWVW